MSVKGSSDWELCGQDWVQIQANGHLNTLKNTSVLLWGHTQ